MDRVTCKYCNETKDACLFIKDKKPYRCRKCYNKLYGNGQFDDNVYLAKHGYTSNKTSSRRKPRYSELEAKASEMDKYKSLYENSQSQVDTLRKILGLLKKDLEVNISMISKVLNDSAENSYDNFVKNELPGIISDIMDIVDDVMDNKE